MREQRNTKTTAETRAIHLSPAATDQRADNAAKLINAAIDLARQTGSNLIGLAVLKDETGIAMPDFLSAVGEHISGDHLRRADIPGAYSYEIDGRELNAVTLHLS